MVSLLADMRTKLSYLETTAKTGDASAQLELARLYLAGREVPRDLARSRAYFGDAAKSGNRIAAEIYRAFVANGTGGVPDWRGAIRLLEADRDDDACRQISLISAMKLKSDGHSSKNYPRDIISSDPLIASFRSFLSQSEANYLITRASARFQPSSVVHPLTGALIDDPIRSSYTAAFPLALEQPAIHAINLRIADATNSPVSAGEPLTILRYSGGQQYRLHLDVLPNTANQRAFTMLIYLNDEFLGGETSFPKVGLNFRGRKGDALLIHNLRSDGSPDPRLLHEGRPVTMGVKFIASRWIRLNPLIV